MSENSMHNDKIPPVPNNRELPGEEKAAKKYPRIQRKPLSFKSKVLFILIPLILLLILGEIFLRILGVSNYQLDPTVYPNVPGDLTPRQDFILHTTQTGVSYRIKVNAQGFRGQGLIRKERPCMILCLGDSSMMGYGVGEGETAPDWLRKWLEIDYPGVFDVINAASIGYTIDDEIAYMKDKGLDINPDFVLLEIFFNDPLEKEQRSSVQSGTQRDFRKTRLPYIRFRSLLLKSQLFQSLRMGFIRLLVKFGRYFPPNRTDMMEMAMFPSRHQEVWEPYDEACRDFVELMHKREIPLVVAVTPHQYQVHRWGRPLMPYYGVREYQDHVLGVLSQLKKERKNAEGEASNWSLQAVDLMPVYLTEMQDVPSVYLTGGLYDEHPNAAGQYIKARELYVSLKKALNQAGFYNFYHRFPGADVSGEAFQGRRWVSQKDAYSLVLHPGARVIYEGVHLSDRPWLKFTPSIPWYAGDEKRAPYGLSLLISLKEVIPEKAQEEQNNWVEIYSHRFVNGKPAPGLQRISLHKFAKKNVMIRWQVEAEGKNGRGKQTGQPDVHPSVCILAPIIINLGPEDQSYINDESE